MNLCPIYRWYNIEHLYLHIYFLLVWVIECLITGLKLKMAYLWLQSLMQSIDFKSFSHYLFNDCVSMYKHMLSHIFLDYKNSSKCEIHTCLQISCNQGWGNIAWDPFPFSSFQFYNLRASLCKILISSFAHKMDFAHNFPVDFF